MSDVRIERGSGSVAEFHILSYLFAYRMTIRIRVERVEVVCSELHQLDVEWFKATILDVLRALKEHRPESPFRGFALAIVMHRG